MTSISPKTYWIIAIAAVVAIGVLVYWSKVSRVPSPDLSGARQQNQAAQRAAASRTAAQAAAKTAAAAAVNKAARLANPLVVASPVPETKLKLK